MPNSDVFKFDGEITYPELSTLSKPLTVHKNSDFSEICPDKFNYKIYSDLLKANSTINGKIIIYDKSLKNYRKVRQGLLDELIRKYKTPPKQIKFFFVKKHYSDVEFRLAPTK